jgi:uncharacterized membrane protein YbhN (UPF0104 family)
MDEETKTDEVALGPRPGASVTLRSRRWLGLAGLLAVAVVGTVAAFRLIGGVDWEAAWDALRQLSWWQTPLLVVLLLLRQIVNTLPLSFYVAGVPRYRVAFHDPIAVAVGIIAPPPSDLAVRTAMLSSWGVPVAAAAAGALLHKLTFWIVRFGVPLVGIGILLLRGDALGLAVLDLVSIAFAVALVVVLLLVMRSEALASRVGRRGGSLAARFRPVDRAAWAASCVRFRACVAGRFRGGFPRALAAMSAMLAIEVVMLVLCLRFVGADRVAAPTSVVVAAYATTYPLTIFPFAGLGLLDAAVVGAITAVGGNDVTAPAMAALIVWRGFTLGGPVLLGAASAVLWRHTPGSGADLWGHIRGRGENAH